MTALTDMADLTVEDGVALITLDNPPVNALSQGAHMGVTGSTSTCRTAGLPEASAPFSASASSDSLETRSPWAPMDRASSSNRISEKSALIVTPH